MILEIDAGNTRLKWRLVVPENHEPVVARGVINNTSNLERGLSEGLGRYAGSISRARMVCVGPDAVALGVESWVTAKLSLPLERVVVEKEVSGIVNPYTEPRSLGADRWTAVLAASRLSYECVLIVDCGSAITIDMLHGRHYLGGYIAPGYSLMQRALFKDTANVNPDDISLPSVAPGSSTSLCVHSGLWLSLLGLVVQSKERLALESGVAVDRVVVVLCGGDAVGLKSLMPFEVQLKPELVMDGLSVVLP